MKFLSNLKPMTRKIAVLGVIGAALIGTALFTSVNAQNVSFNSGTDCDNNAVITGGALSVNSLVNKYDVGSTCSTFSSDTKSIHDVYNYFGISSAEVHSMPSAATTVSAGTVDKAGNVYDANGVVVATNAVTAGMENIAGSTAVTSNGTTFYTREPSVSFRSNTLDAFVVLVNGKFSYAIIAACGNPVKATPKVQPTPNYTITKEVVTQGQAGYSNNVTVGPNTKVTYRITVKSTGDAPVKNLLVKDALPAHVTYVDNTLKLDGSTVSDATFFTSGYPISSLSTTAVFTFDAIVGKGDTATTCTAGTFNNVGSMTATSLPDKNDNATVTERCTPPTPTYACTSLTQVANSRTTYGFTANATAQNGATITGYQFNYGDNKSETVASTAGTISTSHTYAAPGTYAATVSVLVSVNGAAPTPVTAPACAVSVTVAPAPAAECTGLKLDVDKKTRHVSATTTIALHNGATLNIVSYNFDDGSTPVVRNDLNAVSHTYSSDGNYTVKATVTFNNAENTPPSVCLAPVSFSTTPPVVTTASRPTTLVNTGPGTTIAIFGIVTAAAAFMHRSYLSRRLSSEG